MHTSQKIGLIAGQGKLPQYLIASWRSSGLTPVIVGLKGITPAETLAGNISKEFSIGQAGHILDYLHAESITQIVMAGALRRPNFLTLKTDRVGLGIIARLICRRMGDDTLLKIIRHEFEKRGIAVVGAHTFLPDIISPAGVMGKITPDSDDTKAILLGFRAAKAHGTADKGQSVVVNNKGIRAQEGRAGTSALMRACTNFKDKSILVKVSKPQQDLAIDMPTIGLSTVEVAHQSGFKGIAIEAHKTIILDRADVIKKCDEYKIFIIGIEEEHVA